MAGVDDWSEEEFAAAVGAYREMLSAHVSGGPVDRATVRRKLREGALARRSDASIEYRMRNISAVLEILGQPYLPGYVPARHVGIRGTQIITRLLEGVAVQDEAIASPAVPNGRNCRMFVTGMWGFDPAREGYVGFSLESTRDRLIADFGAGDLMLIVGQKGKFSNKGDVGRLLGIVELAPEPILEAQRMSPEHYKKKVERFGNQRWQFGLPVKRAWVMGRELKASVILPASYSAKNARSVGAGYRELIPDEVARVLSLPVKASEVWGEPDWKPETQNAEGELSVTVAVSRGPSPWFGKTETQRTDGETKVYLMQLTGCVDALFPKHLPNLYRKAIVKVGRSSDPKRREEELNCGFPPSADIRWTLKHAQSFKNANDAHSAEQSLLTHLESRKLTLGNEFAMIPLKEVDTLLAMHVGPSAFHIKV